MTSIDHWLLTSLLLVPAAGAVAVLIVRRPVAVRWIALSAAATSLLVAVVVLVLIRGPGAIGHPTSRGEIVWSIYSPGVTQNIAGRFGVMVDGLALSFVLLTTIVCVAACIASWSVERRCALYFSLLLLFETTILGGFVAFDLAPFWFFLLLSIAPACLLLGIWGGARARRAATRLFVYLLVSSLCLLVSMIGLHIVTPLPQTAVTDETLFVGLTLVAFLIRLAAAPVHSWLPETIAQAPPAVGVLLGALIPATGGYGLVRFALPLFSAAARSLSPMLAALGIFSVLYGALCAIGQRSPKRLVGYGSISLLGFALIGIANAAPAGANAAIFVFLSHGLILGMVLMVVRRGAPAPSPARFAPIAWFAYLVLPGLMAQYAVLLALFQSAGFDSASGTPTPRSQGLVLTCGIAGAVGIVLTAAYMVRFLDVYVRVDTEAYVPERVDARQA